MGATQGFQMNILPHKITTTNADLTSRAGLLVIAELMQSLQLAKHIDQQFPQPKSNRGFKPSCIIETLILMQHEGSFHLDDVRHLREEDALTPYWGLSNYLRPLRWGDGCAEWAENPWSAKHGAWSISGF